MVDLLKLGSNSLQAMQQALSTTGHNIANVNTDGYNRQRVNFTTAESQNAGFGYLGQGSVIGGIERSYNQFLTTQVQDFTASQSRYEVFVDFSSRVDNILANSDNSLNTSMQKYFSAISDVAASPSTLPERQVLLGEAENLVARQRNFSNLLQDLNSEVNSALRYTVDEINSLSANISYINKEIVSAISSANGAAPNDLLDQRDSLIKQLSTKISVSTVAQDDGAINVFIGKGQALVIGAQSTNLIVQANPYDSASLEVGVEGQINVSGLSEFVKGGELEGLLDFRNRVLLPAQTQLGLVVLGLSEGANAQQQSGMDLNGAIGNDFFSTGNISVAGHVSNVGTATPVVALNDVGSVRASDYEASFNGTQWQLIRLSDNTSVSGTSPLVLDGLSVDVSSGTPVAGDSFIFNPAREAAAKFSLAISDPRKIAAASAVNIQNTSSNLGAGELSELNVTAPNSLPLSSDITLTFNPAIPGFDVTGGITTTLAYDPTTESAGKSFNFPSLGISFTLSDVPQPGDEFVIGNNNGAIGDNSNALEMGNLQYQNVLNGGQDTYQELYGSMVAQVGVVHRQATANLAVETSLLSQAEEYRDSISGVNLDEEAANLLRYQQSYQAAAQLIKVADELFQTLINSIR